MIELAKTLDSHIINYDKLTNKQIADSIKKMSDFYIENPLGTTPWHLNWALTAQTYYYLPLNYIRNITVFNQSKKDSILAKKLKSLTEISITDYGCGLGAASLAFMDCYSDSLQQAKINLHLIDQSKQALSLSSDLIEKFNKEKNICISTNEKINVSSLKEAVFQIGLFSYSLTELKKIPDWISKFDVVFILEPSTQQDGRLLMKFRDQAVKENFSVLFPCVHTENCPLLNESKTDWCHQRIHWKPPSWFVEIEKHLPFKNQTLTYSSLVISKKNLLISRSWGRVVGDQLDEKGKSRVLICRNSQREYLSWLHRDNKNISFSRGESLTEPLKFEKLGNELRIKNEENL